MVAVVSGSGLGLFGSSVTGLGGAGAAGNASLGRGGDRVYVNTATGNLIVQSQDEILRALGLDLALIRTYNSQGLLDDDNRDNWRLSAHQRVFMLSGTPNTSGSTIAKVFGDGREVLYTYNDTLSAYVSTEGDGAHDTLSYNSSTTLWTWTEGSARISETYDSNGRLLSSTDADSNTITYTYTDSLLRQVTDASGQVTHLDYDGDDLTQIRVVSDGQTQTITRYSYDTDHRLTQVQVDLSPDDNSVTDNDVYTTTYTYEDTSRRIASITQTDGTSVAFTYQLIDGAHRVHTYTDGEGRVTTLTYTQPSVTGTGGSQSVSAKGAVLTTTDIQTTTTNPSLNTGATSTSDVQTNIHDLNTAALTGAVNSSPVVQSYLDAASQVIGTLHADGSLTTYSYTVHGQRATATRHAAAPVSPLWAQDFSQNAAGFEPLISGFVTHENGALTVSTGDMAEGYQMSLGTRDYDFDDHVVFRSEVTTGTDDSFWRLLYIGAQNLDETRRHGAFFRQDQVWVSYYDNGWQDALLGTVADNTTYVVEVVTHSQGSTLYVYAKGTDRDAGYRHDLGFTDWGEARSFFETYGATDYGPSTMRLDNVSEASTLGALVGPWIATEGAGDLHVYYDDAGRVAGTVENGMYTSYNYDALGQLVSLRHHASAVQPLWSQDFAHDANGFDPLYAGINTHENGGLTVSAGPDPDSGWRMSHAWNSYDFDDHLVYRGEVNTGSSTSARNFGLGAVSTDSTRQHEAAFIGGHVFALHFDQDWQYVDLGAIDDDKTYVVEVVMEATGSTLYVYEKGTDRASGYSDHVSFTDWGDVRIFFETYIGVGQGESDVRLDNLSIATVSGPLIGSFIATEGAQDVVTTVSDPDWMRAVTLHTIDAGAATSLHPPDLRVAFDGAGNGFAVFTERDQDVFVSRYTAATDTWSAAVKISAPLTQLQDDYMLELAVDEDGHAAVTWSTYHLPDLTASLNVISFDPQTNAWSTPVQIPVTREFALPDSVSIHGGVTAVVWDEWNEEGPDQDSHRYATIVTAAGAATPTALVTFEDAASWQSAMAVDSSGNAILTWVERNFATSTTSTQTWHYTASTAAWTQGTPVSLDSDLNQGFVAANSNRDLVVAWSMDDNVYVRRATAGGAWGTAVALASPPTGALINKHRVAIDDAGNVLVAWTETLPSGPPHARLAIRRFDVATATWSAAAYLDPEIENGTSPFSGFSVGIDGEHATVTWSEFDNVSSTHLYATQLVDGAWTAPLQLDTVKSTTKPAAIPAGDTVVWTEANADGSASVRARRFSYAPSEYTVASGATWQSVANTLYGVNSAEAGAALQAVLGNPPLTGGTVLTGLPSKLSVTTSITVPAYFTIPSGATWQSIANTLYGVDSVEAGEALRDAMNDPPLTAGTRLTSLPATLSVTTADTLPYGLDTGELTTPSGTWGAAGTLESSSIGAASPRVAFDADGNGFAVWRAGALVYARRYVRATDTWQTAFVLDSTGNSSASSPVLAVDANGNAVAGWVHSDNVSLSIFTAFYDASTGTWGGKTLVENLTGAVSTTEGYVVAAISGDRAVVGWQYSNGDVYVARRSSGTWAAAESIETSSNTARQPNVVIDANGNVLTLWRQSQSSAESILYNRYNAATATWSGPTLLESSSTAADLPRLTFDGGSKAMAIWAQGSNIVARRYDFAAGNWNTQQTIQSGSGLPDAAVLSSDADGNVVAAWQQSDGTADSIWVSRYNATSATWTTPQLLESSNNAVPSDIRCVTTSTVAGRAVVAWLQSDGTRISLYTSQFTGGSWSSPTLREQNNSVDAALPVVAIDGQGNATVVWQQSDGTAVSIYQARFTAGVPYFTVPGGATWQSIANTLYGVNSAEAGAALQAALGNPALTTGAHLTNLPATLHVPVMITVPAYYTVQSGDTWASITETIYDTDDPAAIEALQDALGNPTLSTGLKLTVPMTLTYGEGEGSTVYLQTDVEDALGHVTTYEQDEEGRLTAVLGPTVGSARLETRYTYDNDGNVTSIAQDPDGLNRVTALSYDANGNLLSSRDDLGNTITRTYNSNNQLLTERAFSCRTPMRAAAANRRVRSPRVMRTTARSSSLRDFGGRPRH